MRPGRLSSGIIAWAAGIICLLVYFRALGCDFISYDDPDYVLNNPLIRQLDMRLVVSAFSESYNGWWMPLTWISLAIDYHFWGLNPLGYHLTNILLHSCNAGLVVLIADRIWSLIQERGTIDELPGENHAESRQKEYLYPLTILLAGLLWGIHPLRVESVAWVTERKDVLNGLFTLSSVYWYLRYAQLQGAGREWGRAYAVTLALFALSLMSKSVSVVLPVMLLVLDWHPLDRLHRERLSRVLVEKVPFVLLSVVMVIITIRSTSQAGYLVPYSEFPFSQRLAVSGNALFEYVRLMLFPVGILTFYLIPDPIPVSYGIKAVVFVAGSIFCFRLRNRYPWLPAIWLLIVLPMVPVLAFFQNGDQALAARFTYLPSLSPTIAVVIAAASIYKRMYISRRSIVFCGIGTLMVVLAYAAITVHGIRSWQDSVSFWTRVIDLRPEVASYKERGLLYLEQGNYRAAVNDFSSAIALASGVWKRKIYNLYAFRGEANRSMGLFAEAVQDFTHAISINPHPAYYYHRGIVLQQLGQTAAANADFSKAAGESVQLDWY